MIKTKSLQAEKNKSDGLRVCVMRRVKAEYDFDIWMPMLAPSEALLKKYVIEKEISWEDFRPLFIKELRRQKKFFKLLTDYALKQNVTLLCWEEEPDYCHRSLVLAELKKAQPKLKTKLA